MNLHCDRCKTAFGLASAKGITLCPKCAIELIIHQQDIISKILKAGHNDDCIFCGFKDRLAKEGMRDE